jgi:uncharacterized membrane protein
MNKNKIVISIFLATIICLASFPMLPLASAETTNAQCPSIVPLQVNPDFRIYASPSCQYVIAGSSANSIMRLYPIARFNGTVTLTATSPTGWTTTLSAASVPIKYNAGGSSVLAVSVPLSAASGKYVVTITGTSGALNHRADVIVQVIKPDFNIRSCPSYLFMIAGSSANSLIKVNPEGRFNGTVTLTATYPTGWLANLAQSSLEIKYNAAASTALGISVPANAVAGKYIVTVAGKSGSMSHATDIVVQLINADFGICVNPSYLYVIAGSSANSMIKLYSLGRFNGTVALTATSPAGWTANFSPLSVPIKYNEAGSSVLSVLVPSNAVAGKYAITVTGTSGTTTHPINVIVQVINTNFEIRTTPSYLYVVAGSSATSMVKLCPIGRFNGTVTLTASSPNGWTVSLAPTSAEVKYNLAGLSVLGISVPSNVESGKYIVTVTGTSGSLTHTTDVVVQVIKPDFKIFTVPSNLYLTAGTSADIAIKVQSLSRFNGTISLSPVLSSGWTSTLASS